MKSYLSLIPLSAKIRKRQNRMTILCITISVLLVTAVFSISDMFIRTESDALEAQHGSWHISLEGISPKSVSEIKERPDITAIGCSESFNLDADQNYYIGEKKAALYGVDNTYMTQLTNSVEEGHSPEHDNELMLSSNAKLALDVKVGDIVTLQTPAGSSEFTVSGFGSDDQKYYRGQTYLVAVYMTHASFDLLMKQNNITISPVYYIKFRSTIEASNAIPEIKAQYNLSDENISENTAVMGLSGQSSNESMKNIYGIAAVLFILVLLAGTLMISGSMNSTIARRTEFFGMLRCIGASRRQIIRYVRLEALNWCKTSVPAGLIIGTLISWITCAVLHYGIGGEFITMPVFALSPVGLISGAVVGVAAVLLAAQSPAKRASKISPAAAVSNSTDTIGNASRPAKTAGHGNVEIRLGIHHAVCSKKNWSLLTASFALSIVLFLCFSVGLSFARELLPSMRSWQPDVTLNGYANECVLNTETADTISEIPEVVNVWSCTYVENVPASSSESDIDHINLISYSDSMLDSSDDNITQGDLSEIYGENNKVMTVSSKDNPLKVGDKINISEKTVEVVCSVSDSLYPGEYSVICSEETFESLTGEQNYSLIGIKLSDNAGDETLRQINELAGSNVIFTDLRENNHQDRATYSAVVFIVYSFMAIIAMITLFNIINSISISVNSRIRHYGAMRAVGMDEKQLGRMIAAEGFTYAISGFVVGCAAGILISRFLYTKLITEHFGVSWSLPVLLLVVIVVFDIAAAMIAVHAPAKRIRTMPITEVLNEL